MAQSWEPGHRGARGDAPGHWGSLAQCITHQRWPRLASIDPHHPWPWARSQHNQELNPQGRWDVGTVFRKVRRFKNTKGAGLHQLDLGPENRQRYWHSLGAMAVCTKTTEPLFPLFPGIMILKTTPGWKATGFTGTQRRSAAAQCFGCCAQPTGKLCQLKPMWPKQV